MPHHEKLNYVEFASRNLIQTKIFFERAFGWSFQDYGLDYCAFDNQGLEGGFFFAEQVAEPGSGSALLIFYSQNLEATMDQVKAAGGTLYKDIFAFPGGRRFHFIEPGGNEFAVWTDK